ncbi:MAG: S41 family peptidase [Patescibacteria group bacterium]
MSRALFIFRLVTGVLLVGVGMFGQYRYHLIEKHLEERWHLSTEPASPLSGVLSASNQPGSQPDLSNFWQTWGYLENDFLETEKLDQTTMVDGAIRGLTSSLGDPYTMYLPPKEFQRSGEDLAGSFYGVGIELGYIDQTLAVVAPLKDSPAELAGVKAGDLILKVTDKARDFDEETTDWSLNRAVNEIRGPLGSIVTLTLFRPGESTEPFEISITRGEIVVQSSEVEFVEALGKTVAHIKLYRFGERTNGEWDKIVNQILAHPDLDGVVLDMRGNPGGFFDGAIDVASEFIGSGTVVSQKGKYTNQDFSAKGQVRLVNIPVVVLVNRGSASASEIVAGALRDRLGAKLVGEKTFGKGTVQDLRELPNGGGLHITIARWLLPGGSWIHETGLEVDVEAQDNPDTTQDEVLLEAVKTLP